MCNNHDWGLLLWSEAACLGAGTDANADADANDDWEEDPEEEDGHDGSSTGGGGIIEVTFVPSEIRTTLSFGHAVKLVVAHAGSRFFLGASLSIVHLWLVGVSATGTEGSEGAAWVSTGTIGVTLGVIGLGSNHGGHGNEEFEELHYK